MNVRLWIQIWGSFFIGSPLTAILCCILWLYKYTREHNQLIMTTSITHEYTSLQKYKCLTFYFRKCWFFDVCKRWVEIGTDCYIDPCSSLDHRSSSSPSWLDCSIVGPESPALSLQNGSHAGIPVSNWLMAVRTLSIFFLKAYLLPLFFGLFTQVHLLIDSSVEGQYITIILS